MRRFIWLMLAVLSHSDKPAVAQDHQPSATAGVAKSPSKAAPKAVVRDHVDGIIYMTSTVDPIGGGASQTALGIGNYQLILSPKTTVPSDWDLKAGLMMIGGDLKFRVRGRIADGKIYATSVQQLTPSTQPRSSAAVAPNSTSGERPATNSTIIAWSRLKDCGTPSVGGPVRVEPPTKAWPTGTYPYVLVVPGLVSDGVQGQEAGDLATVAYATPGPGNSISWNAPKEGARVQLPDGTWKPMVTLVGGPGVARSGMLVLSESIAWPLLPDGERRVTINDAVYETNGQRLHTHVGTLLTIGELGVDVCGVSMSGTIEVQEAGLRCTKSSK